MTRTSSVALVGGVLLMVWVLASGSPSPATLPQRDPLPPTLVPSPTNDLDREAARLRDHLANPPRYPPPERDPFAFAAARPAPARARGGVTPAPAPVAVEIPPVPVADVPRLVAVLTDAADGGPIRRAVLAVGDDVQITRLGETVLHYRVRSIGADVVELVDMVTGVVTRVGLR